MPRSRRILKERKAYTDSHVVQLRSGFDYFRDGFGDLRDLDGHERPEVLQAMRRAWPVLKEAVMERDRKHYGLFHRPWSWWRFDRKVADPPRNPSEQKRYLLENDLLTEEERSTLL